MRSLNHAEGGGQKLRITLKDAVLDSALDSVLFEQNSIHECINGPTLNPKA